MLAAGLAAAAGVAVLYALKARRRRPRQKGTEGEHASAKEVSSWAAMAAGERLVPFKYEMPFEPPVGHVDVRITHCGICHSDLHQIDNSWGVASFPLVPGHEIVGVVEAVGDSVDDFEVGDRIAIGVQRGCCESCDQCKAGLEHICPEITKTYAGPGKDKGGFATSIRYPARWLFKCPDHLLPEHVAPLMCAGITTFSPLKRHAKRGDKVGVIGIGGLGHLALQFAKAMKCEVVAISRSVSKTEEAIGFGASRMLISSDEDAMKVAAGSFDVILNTVSGNAPLDPIFALLKPRGKLVCVGLPEKTEKSQLFLHSAVLAERELVGSYLGPRADYGAMLRFAARHGVKPQVELMQASQVNEAVARVRENRARYRIVLQF